MDTLHTSTQPLAELHAHLGQSVEPHILWSIAHEQGIKLPSKDYWEFYDMVTLNKPHVSWEDYHKLFTLTELVQSSPAALEKAIYETITGAYRVNNITLIEPSFNPMFRNRGGERDLDHIILGALRGMEKALVEFSQVHAGLILALDRRLTYEQNEIIAKKAMKYARRGIVGIDIQGPQKDGFFYKDYADLYKRAQDAGLKTTVHTGEDGTPEEMDEVISVLPLNRVNHGIKCVESKELMQKVIEKNLTLCICPTSNLSVGFIRDIEHLKQTIQTMYHTGVKFCINTDNPSMLRTNLKKEIQMMRDHNILSEEQITQTINWAFEASFINLPKNSNDNLYL